MNNILSDISSLPSLSHLIIRQYYNRYTKVISDDLILHQFPRGHCIPNLSGFCLKLETFLRIAKIPYKNSFGFEMSPKGKCPWVEYKGEIISDSQLIIERLNKDLNVNLNQSLDRYGEGVARALLKLIEEDLYRCLGLWRWCNDPSTETLKRAFPGLPFFVRWKISREVRKASMYHGIGRHTQTEIDNIAMDDIKAISNIMGEQDYIFGNEVCETDCIVFGHLSQIRWALPGSVYETYMRDELPNLWSYCERMKRQYWPDWDEELSDN